MADVDLRALEGRARETGDVNDVNAYVAALMSLGSDALQGLLGTGHDAWQNLVYRHALKLAGGGQAGLDLSLPHMWRVLTARSQHSYGELRQIMSYNWRNDQGIQPFFLDKARPLTFKETIQARLDQFEKSEGKEWYLWDASLSTCTGIVWEAGCMRFKIVPMHPDLLAAPPSSAEYLPADFSSTVGRPLTVDDTYDRPLTVGEALVHEGLIAAVEGDVDLLKRFVQVEFARRGRVPHVGFFITLPEKGLPDHLRSLTAEWGGDCEGGAPLNFLSAFAAIESPFLPKVQKPAEVQSIARRRGLWAALFGRGGS